MLLASSVLEIGVHGWDEHDELIEVGTIRFYGFSYSNVGLSIVSEFCLRE